MAPVRIVVVEGHTLFREALVQLLKGFAQIEVVGEAKGLGDTLAIVAETKPDILLLNFDLPERGGEVLLQQLKYGKQPVKTVVVTKDAGEPEFIKKMFDEGVRGCAGRDSDSEQFIKMLETVHHMGYYFDKKTQEAFIQVQNRKNGISQTGERLHTFSNDELLIIAYAIWEKQNSWIGKKMAKSKRTVEEMRSGMIHRVGGETMMCVVAYVFIHKLMPDELLQAAKAEAERE